MLVPGALAFAAKINPANDGSKYAWAESLGWVNFQPSGPGVQVSDSALTGYAWSANVGWISLSCANANC